MAKPSDSEIILNVDLVLKNISYYLLIKINIINAFTVTFEHFNASLLTECNHFFWLTPN